MRFSRFFIDRPIFAAVLSVFIVLVGLFAYPGLPVAQYPEIVPPTVTVSAVYPGASAEVVADTVATPLEQEINGVEDMLYMFSSSAGDGRRRADFKTAVQEYVFEVEATIGTLEATKAQLAGWMEPVEAPIPKFLAASGHRGVVHREPYGVTLILCPSNGPLLLSLRPAAAALSAGNPCILKLSELLPATNAALLELIPLYFEPDAFAAVPASARRSPRC